MSFIHKVLLL